jgi:hypothetical protein
MTVKELKEKLNQFDDNLIVMIPNKYWEEPCQSFAIPLRNISRGVNEFDGCLFLDEYEEDE